jgi:hypothetical protein
VKMEKKLVCAWQLLLRGRNLWPFVRTQGMCITLLVPLPNVISERRMLQNRRVQSMFKMEKNIVKMEKNLVKMERVEKMDNFFAILEKIRVMITSGRGVIYRDWSILLGSAHAEPLEFG